MKTNKNSQKQHKSNYLALTESFSAALSHLKSNLMEAAAGHPAKLLMVTSSKSGEGKTLAAISIAKTLAQGKKAKVLLIDINFNAPQLHHVFEIPQQPGLADLVLEQVPSSDCCSTTGINNLDVLPIGSKQDNSNWLFDTDQFAQSLSALAEQYDYVVVDTNSFLGASEVSLICPLFDAILLVVECEVTKWQVAKTTAEKIQNARGNLLGTVMNRRKFYIPRFFYG